MSDVAISLFPFVQSSYLSLGQYQKKKPSGQAEAIVIHAENRGNQNVEEQSNRGSPGVAEQSTTCS